MTEELKQRAEEYKESKRHKCFREDVGTIQINYESYLNNLKQAYLAGATENGIQWHDLRKDPKDLPKNEGSYLVCMEFNYRHTYILNYGQDDYDDEDKTDWYDDESTHYPKEVIAWCEIPQFKE